MNAPEDQNGLREALARAEADNRKLREKINQQKRDVYQANRWYQGFQARALAAEAEITRLKEGMEGLKAKAEEQVAHWRERQAAEKALEDGVSEDGETYTPMGDHAAWQAGYCNGRMSEADWWRWTLKELATLSPKEHPHG